MLWDANIKGQWSYMHIKSPTSQTKTLLLDATKSYKMDPLRHEGSKISDAALIKTLSSLNTHCS